MLFDPFEEELHMPATAIEVGDAQCRQAELIGQEYEALVGLRIDVLDATERNGKFFVRIEATQDHGLIADQTGTVIHRMGIATLGIEVFLGARDEETASLVQGVQPLEVEVPAIHQVVGSWLGQERIEHVDLVHLAVGNVNKARDIAAQTEQGVQFDCGLRRTKRRPGKDRQAQIDCRGVEGVNRLGQIHAEGFLGIQASRDADKSLGEARVDTPISGRVGVGQRVARDVAANPQVIELRRLGSQARLDISQTLPEGQLGEGHAHVLVETRKALDLVLPGIASDAAAESCQREMPHQLRENELALMHRSTPRRGPRVRCATANRCSNRDQQNMAFSVSCSTT